MDTLQFLFFVVLALAALAVVYILFTRPTNGNPWIAGGLCVLFAGYTAVQIAQEGAVMFFTNHTANLTGLQVWWDLAMSVAIALFFIIPRARAVGMNVLPWCLLVAPIASIGLLAMCARLFWLEARAAEAASTGAPARA